jgi:hypothetical protein
VAKFNLSSFARLIVLLAVVDCATVYVCRGSDVHVRLPEGKAIVLILVYNVVAINFFVARSCRVGLSRIPNLTQDLCQVIASVKWRSSCQLALAVLSASPLAALAIYLVLCALPSVEAMAARSPIANVPVLGNAAVPAVAFLLACAVAVASRPRRIWLIRAAWVVLALAILPRLRGTGSNVDALLRCGAWCAILFTGDNVISWLFLRGRPPES